LTVKVEGITERRVRAVEQVSKLTGNYRGPAFLGRHNAVIPETGGRGARSNESSVARQVGDGNIGISSVLRKNQFQYVAFNKSHLDCFVS